LLIKREQKIDVARSTVVPTPTPRNSVNTLEPQALEAPAQAIASISNFETSTQVPETGALGRSEHTLSQSTHSHEPLSHSPVTIDTVGGTQSEEETEERVLYLNALQLYVAKLLGLLSLPKYHELAPE